MVEGYDLKVTFWGVKLTMDRAEWLVLIVNVT